jgi:oligopeptide transport system substrate-binding protein
MRRPRSHLALLGLALVSVLLGGCASTSAADRPVRILAGDPATLDPAAQGDGGTAAVVAQLFETLTTFDADLEVRPALAESWRVEAGGERVVFQLRPNLTFSDGSPLRASDVVRSWLRIIDPTAPSPLASLMLVVDGATDYLAGRSSDPATVGLTADDDAGTVTVDLTRPASDFVEAVGSPTFGVVPPGPRTAAEFRPGPDFVGSGGYLPTSVSPTGMMLTAHPGYWAGKPAIDTIELVSDLGGRSAVEVFEDGDLDYTSIFDSDASWIAYDPKLGPQLRQVPALTSQFYGFDTRKPPFDDVRVRQAFAMAVDWRRIARLGAPDESSGTVTSMVPPGIPGRSERDFLPPYDPARARSLLAAAGFPGGAGFPRTTLMTGGGGADEAVLDEIKRELGIDLGYETMSFDTYFTRLAADPPAMWSLGWIADYPGRNDFLGVLLASDSTNNYGSWSSPAFDAAVAKANAATDPVVAAAAYDEAEAIVASDAPVIPIGYGTGWALAREGLLGASEAGLGIVRMAGLAWAD